ncbi:formate dehydrogenase subunit gamma [Thalassotalea ponticola]|uniref:formate dehydrogenase subunit gamma n=1 Tax=Thalassotalea ponticola TaxID=1523392 RepID=UPI0025B3AA92|nr:formate dehydrogenase subunit gamma [Thalassotalea ponticola]MDN3653957.1 formate dehydrogenase subunit gamma [Thalassotalea ponticola]
MNAYFKSIFNGQEYILANVLKYLYLALLLLFVSAANARTDNAKTESTPYVLLAAAQSTTQSTTKSAATSARSVEQVIPADVRAVLESTGVTSVQDWSALGEQTSGYTVSTSKFHPQAINPYDLGLINMRSDLIAPGFIVAFFGMIILFTLFSLINGSSKVEAGFSGKKMKRWSAYDLFIHWLCAVPCILLIISGMVLLTGRYYIEPNVSGSLWNSIIYLAKSSHDILVYPFFAGWLLICVSWLKEQWPQRHDWSWFKAAGGYINMGPFKGKHPDSGFVNAGEKVWFWCLVLAGIFLIASGAVLMFPAQLDASRTMSVWALLVHSGSALIIAAFAIVHIFMATVLAPGTLSAMTTGYVDENWAKQHHNLWYEKVTGKTAKTEH